MLKKYRTQKTPVQQNQFMKIEGMEEPLDPKNSKKKDELYGSEKYSSEQFDEKLEKSYREDINNSMKSTFDKLFEEVMGPSEDAELDALGIETDEGADDATEGSDEVTLTLDRAMAEKLCDLLKEACGEEDDAAEAEDGEYEEYEEAEEDDDEDAEEVEEAVEAEDHGHALVNQKDTGLTKVGAGSNKVKSTATGKATSGKADGKIKKQDDGEGSAMTGDGGLTSTGSGSNKVKSSKTSKVGASLFA